MKNWYQMTKEETLEQLGVTHDGLSSEKAKQLLEENGPNVLDEAKRSRY